MKKIYFSVLYGVQQMVFNVGKDGIKTHYDPIYGKTYAYASADNVKHNIKELFSCISGIKTPRVEFKKKGSVKNNILMVNEDGSGEQSGVSILIDFENTINAIFGAWNSDTSDKENKYEKAALKACFNVSDLMPIHPLLQSLGGDTTGVFVGDKNSIVTIGVNYNKKDITIKSPEDAVKLVACSIENAKEKFSNLRPLNLYEAHKTANGLYKETFTIDIETFGMVKRSSCTIDDDDEKIKKCIENGWRNLIINGEKYLAPPKDELLKLWEYFVEALLFWDFSSNNSRHGSIKEELRYSVSFNAHKINQCTSAATYNDGDNVRAKLVLRDSDEVYNFNTTSLEKYYICDNVETSIDADEEVRGLLLQLGKENIQ